MSADMIDVESRNDHGLVELEAFTARFALLQPPAA